jgi:multidrug efflux pump
MNPVALFIGRPVATTLLTIGITLAGIISYFLLPVAPFPQVDIPTIVVYCNMAGASPETMASTVATPLERHLGTIADVTEMTSTSNVGSTNVILQFGLNRDINGAARDVQAAINAALTDLPSAINGLPGYWRFNPSEAPIIMLAMTSDTLTPAQLYDSAASVLQQKISQVDGVGNVRVSGSALPGVRVELNPRALFKYGIGTEDVRAALAGANANAPKGALESGDLRWQLYTNDQATHAYQYRSLIVAMRQGHPVRLSDVADVIDSVEDVRNMGVAGDKPAVVVQVTKQPGANIIDTAERVKALLPVLKASIPADITLTVPIDLTNTIRGSVNDVQKTLLISLCLVIGVVFFFLRDARASAIPSIAVPISVISTFAVMEWLDYSLNNLTLMALTVSTGFVVDDAIVVVENVVRLREEGMSSRQATLQGTKEVAFTVLSMSLSLIAVFIPLLFMGGLAGRFIRNFAVTLSATISVSLVVSLTITPVLCTLLLKDHGHHKPSRLMQWSEHVVDALKTFYAETLSTALRHPWITFITLILTVAFNVYLFGAIPKGFVPQQDTGTLQGGVEADQSTSFQGMSQKLKQVVEIIRKDPDVRDVVGFTGGGGFNGGTNSARVLVTLKPLKERDNTADQIMNRLRPELNSIPGAVGYLFSAQSIGGGGRQSNAQYQYTLEGEDIVVLREWVEKLTAELKKNTLLTDVSNDQQNGGLESNLELDRAGLARLGLTVSQVDNALYDAFGQRRVSTIFNPLNQYHVVMEVAPKYWQNPDILSELFVSTAGGAISGTHATNAVSGTSVARNSTVSASSVAQDTVRNSQLNAIATLGRGATSTGSAVSTSTETMIPLASVAHFGSGKTPLQVNHQGHYVAATISYNLAEGKSLSDGEKAIAEASAAIHMPTSVHGDFAGNAKFFQDQQNNTPILLFAAIATLYIVLGILYESTKHPITILSTLPSAGVGALLALMAFNTEFSIIALIGILLLIGIVKKNAIMMVDVALQAKRERNMSSVDAIYYACLLRFRPILMTTMVAMFGALPLALGHGDGAELRQPLGISVMGGLFVSQILTLYTTPVVFLLLDRASWGGVGRRIKSIGSIFHLLARLRPS